MYELPYNKCYAVISAGIRKDYIILSVDIRNPEHGEFRGDFELKSTWYFDKKYPTPYGGEVEVDGSGCSLNLRVLKNAVKTLSKVEKKLTSYNNKHGHIANGVMIPKIMRVLNAAGVGEVRVYGRLSGPFPGWNNVEPLSLNNPELIDRLIDLEQLCFQAQEA